MIAPTMESQVHHDYDHPLRGASLVCWMGLLVAELHLLEVDLALRSSAEVFGFAPMVFFALQAGVVSLFGVASYFAVPAREGRGVRAAWALIQAGIAGAGIVYIWLIYVWGQIMQNMGL